MESPKDTKETPKVDHSEHSGHKVSDDPLKEDQLRYLAYANRVLRVVAPAKRYLAFSSDVGEAVRPVVSPALVNATYALTASYIAGDVAYSGYTEAYDKKSSRAKVYDTIARVTTFQLIASLALPFLLIHGGVNATQKLLRRAAVTSPRMLAWTPSAVGLGMIPLMPYTIDHPVEAAIEHAFDTYDPFQCQKQEKEE
eukprot:GEMP01061840.1.p1 GENE.GEMP01061840.1~~GEMP01061840.1.p1  ORF type:complete len:197 (+),score=32.45 GEMP01061840.1:250-840(+)